MTTKTGRTKTSVTNTQATKVTQLFPLIAIFSCALIPLLSAYYLFFWSPESLPLEPNNNGQLLKAPIKLSEHHERESSHPLPQKSIQPNWQLATLFTSPMCPKSQPPKTTQDRNNRLSSIITALGREAHRVRLTQHCLPEGIIENRPNTPLLTGIIDPKGFLILLYPESANQREIYQDMKRLLKYSKAG